jgi:hypothetical protein
MEMNLKESVDGLDDAMEIGGQQRFMGGATQDHHVVNHTSQGELVGQGAGLANWDHVVAVAVNH